VSLPGQLQCKSNTTTMAHVYKKAMAPEGTDPNTLTEWPDLMAACTFPRFLSMFARAQ